MQLSQLITVTLVVLSSYLVDSKVIRGRRSTPSLDVKCQAKMKAMYSKQINVHAVNATHNLGKHPLSNTEEEYPVDFDSDQDCPSEPLTGIDDKLSDRSICPWYAIVNYDEFRYPQDLIEVRCRCEECIKADGVCERVYYNVPVLRYDTKKKGNCGSRLKWSWKPVSVGCICARKRSH